MAVARWWVRLHLAAEAPQKARAREPRQEQRTGLWDRVRRQHELPSGLSGDRGIDFSALCETRYLTGRTFREVAEAQRVSEAAAKARVRRGLAELRRRLGPTALVVLLAGEAKAGLGVDAGVVTAAVATKKWVVTCFVLIAALGGGLAAAYLAILDRLVS